MIADGLVGEADSVASFVSNLVIDFFAASHGGAEPLAGIVYFFPVGGLCHYGLGVIGERAHVIADGLFLLFHKFSFVNWRWIDRDFQRPSPLSADGWFLVKRR